MTMIQDKYMQEYKKDGFVDLSSYVPKARFNYHNICGPKGTGKSTILSALCCFYDDQVKADEMFSNCEYLISSGKLYDQGKHPVIDLDFSDYAATNMEGAYAFFRAKMSDLYLRMWKQCMEEIRYFTSCEKYLDVVEGVCDIEELKYSLE